MSLRDKLIKNSTVAKTAILSESSFFIEKEQVPTAVPMINVALSGTVDGGVSAGLTTIAGPSKHFKTAFSLLLASAFLNKHKDSILLFYDTEFGTPQAYFDTFNIPTDRVIHTPITDIEELKHDIMSQLKDITDKDKVCIIIDSIGNIASRKEVEDAEEGKTVADMSRAKQLKSLFRMVTPHLSLKRIPMFVINHTYKTLEMFSKDVVSGGCVVENTYLLTADGGCKPIQDIVVGDQVRTLNGTNEVTAVWNPDTLDEGTPDCFEIEFEDGYIVTCSDKHKFLVDGEWIEAAALSVGVDVSVVSTKGNIVRWHNNNCKEKNENQVN
jgi:hypothetical protein